MSLGRLVAPAQAIGFKTQHNRQVRYSPASLVDLPDPTHPRLSPTGRHVIYQSAPSGRASDHECTTLWLADASRAKSARQFTSGLFHDRSPEWRPSGAAADEPVFSFLSDRAKRGKSCALYCMSIAGGEAYPVTDVECEQEISAYAWASNAAFVAYASPDELTVDAKRLLENGDGVKVYGERWEYARLRLLHCETRTESRPSLTTLSMSWTCPGAQTRSR